MPQEKVSKRIAAQVLKVTPQHIAALLQTGHNLFAQGRLKESTAIFEGLAIMDFANPYVHSMLGAIYQRLGEKRAAVAEYSQALSIFENDLESLVNRGELYLQLGKFPEAAADFKKAVSLDSKRSSPSANRARILSEAARLVIATADQKGVDSALKLISE